MATQSHSTSNGTSGGMSDFAPINFDVESLPPDAGVGGYDARIEKARARVSGKGNPTIVLDVKLLTADEAENEASEKAVISEFLSFLGEDAQGNKFAKLRLRKWLDKLGIGYDIVPKRIESLADFDELCDALQGQELKVYVSHRTDKESGDVRCQINLDPPKSAFGAEAADAEPEAPPAKTPTKKAAAKAAPATRRR